MFALLTSKQGKRRGDGTVWHISRHTRPRSSTRTDKADLCHDICNQTERRHTAAFLSVYDCKINLHTYTPTAACIVSGGLRESVSIPILQFFFIRKTLFIPLLYRDRTEAAIKIFSYSTLQFRSKWLKLPVRPPPPPDRPPPVEENLGILLNFRSGSLT